MHDHTTKIFAFGHRQRVGKDTCGKFLNTILSTSGRNLHIRRVGFGDEIKDTAFRIYSWAGLRDRAYYDQHQDEKSSSLSQLGKTVRQVWIEVGIKFREIYPDTWLDFVLKQKADVLIIPDLRFPNEAERIRALGGKLFKVTRSSATVSDDPADTALCNWTDWDEVIENEGTLHELYAKMAQVIENHFNQ